MAATQFSVKLLVNTGTNKVLFAEAAKEVVDFLFGLLEMPLGSVVSLLTTEKMVGCLGNLFGSVEAMDTSYFQSSTQGKVTLLNPEVQSSVSYDRLLLPPANTSGVQGRKRYFRCANRSCYEYVSDVSGVAYPSCNNTLSREVTFVADPKQQGGGGGAKISGYVKEMVTYTITDDLTVTPMSNITILGLLHKCDVTCVRFLEERVVNLGFNEGVELLKASLQSKTVLSDVFLKTANKSQLIG